MSKHSLGSDVLNIMFKNTLQVISNNCVGGDSNSSWLQNYVNFS